MPITRTRSRRYVATCDVADCDWPGEMHRHRVVVSERLRHHLKVKHGLTRTEGTVMKTPTNELPKDEGLDKLTSYKNQVIVVGKGWSHDPAYGTVYGPREAIVADVYTWDAKAKSWRNLAGDGQVSGTPIFFKTVIKQLLDAGDEDDFGGILIQGAPGRKNTQEYVLVPPVDKGVIKLLDSFEAPSF